MEQKEATLRWKFGVLTVQAAGGMIGPTVFTLPNGRQISPFHLPHWWNNRPSEADALTQNLRGEWPCVPFGYPMDPDDFPTEWQDSVKSVEPVEFAHGYSSHHDWHFENICESEIRMECIYPDTHDISRLVRILRPDPKTSAIDMELEIHARRETSQPVALHACWALPPISGRAELKPGYFRKGRTHPGRVEAAAPIFAANTTFNDLSNVDFYAGGQIDARELPFDFKGEDLLQLDDIDGNFELYYPDQKAKIHLSWDATILPSVLLWYSNGGRSFSPWNGQHYCIGIEPCASPFGLHPETARRKNPINEEGTATSVALSPAEPLVIKYRIEASDYE